MKKIMLLSVIAIFISIACLAQLPKIENGGLVLAKPVLFETGSAVLTAESDAALQQVKTFLDAKDYITLMRVEGHLSAGGDETRSQTLSEKRALAVCQWLIKKGVDCKRLVAVGFGSNKPIEDNSIPEGKAKNNRIEFKMATLRGKAIGGMPVDGGGKMAGDVCN